MEMGTEDMGNEMEIFKDHDGFDLSWGIRFSFHTTKLLIQSLPLPFKILLTGHNNYESNTLYDNIRYKYNYTSSCKCNVSVKIKIPEQLT